MGFENRHRAITTIGVMALLVAGVVMKVGGGNTTPALTPSQQEFVDTAISRFADQGLVLPDLRFEFHESTLDCGGHKGYYLQETATLHMCGMDRPTLLHELAHAWAGLNLTEAEKLAFTTHRGLATWNDLSHPWEERATEHAAETIAWALLEEANTVRFVTGEPAGAVFRVLTIEDSSVEELHENFVLLTGINPIYRTPGEWHSASLEAEWQQASSASSSPEFRR